MKDKALLALLLGVGLASGQQISITSMLQKRRVDPVQIQKLPLPQNCNKADFKNVCLECFAGYEVKEGLCVKTVVKDDEDDMADYQEQYKEGFLPCFGKDSCGEAQIFKTQRQFSDFVAKFTSQSQYPIKGASQFDQMQTFLRPALMPSAKPMAMMTADSASFSGMSAGKISPSPAPQPAPDRDFSGTNNQVQGVDQADLLKTDGTYIYTISNKMLSIILAYPSHKASVISKINLGTLNAQALFIQGNFLSLFGTDYSTGRAFTFIRIYDISNRAQPFLSRTFKVQGRYINGRKTSDGFVYLITTQSLYYRISPWYDFGLGKKIIPFTSIFRYPITYVQPQLTNIISFNLGKPTSNERKVVSICGQTSNIMYMSDRHIYLTSTSWANGQDYTNIRKIFVWRKYIVPFADGKVQGTINNQFSMDEYGPYLRVATTTNNGGKTQNNLYALGYYLKRSGELRGIAPGERIFSARFVQRKLYLVTFRQIDPFFVISFANHKKPKILGQLNITGFSRYLHPYDDQTIIGFGREADENGRQKGLKITLFDVSDVSNPRQIDSKDLKEGVAGSSAEWEHKAFLFSLEKNMLVVPTSLNEGESKFNGALIFHVDKKEGLALKKIVNHVEDDSDNFYERNVQRSLYIEQLLYTKSKCLLKINDISQSYDDVKSVKIPCDQAEPIIRYPKLSPILPRPIPMPMPIPMPIEQQPFPIFRNPIDRLQPISQISNAI